MSKNVIFKFEDMNSKDKASKAVLANFKRSGAEAVQIDVSATTKRTSGISYRELSLTFADSQVVVFRIKQSGDIFQVLLNGKVKPMTKQDDHAAAIDEIVKAMENGRSAFQQKLAKAKVTLPKSIKTTVPNKEKALTEKRDALQEAIAEAEKTLEDLRSKKPKPIALDSVYESFTQYDLDAHQAATSPYNRTLIPEMQDLIAGNYKKGTMQINGMTISIENPADSLRKGVSGSGETWEVQMKHHYGYFNGSMGADGDEVDVFVKNHLTDVPEHAYIINQVKPDGSFDEHKVVIGATSEDEAKEIYHSNYREGWDGFGSIETISLADLETKLNNPFTV